MLARLPAPHYHPRVRTLLQALALTAAGAAAGLAMNAASPRPARLNEPVRSAAEAAGACKIPGATGLAPRISVQEAAPLCIACSAGFVDARSAVEFAAGHVSGAVHLPPGPVPLQALLHLERFRTVVVYDGDAEAARAAETVAAALRERGMTDVRVLAGSWNAWMAAGAPGESGPCGTCGTGLTLGGAP